MRQQRGNFVIALFLITLGAWLVMGGLDFPLPGMRQMWPVVLGALGLAMLTQAAGGGRRDEGLVLFGVAALLVGAFLFLFTFNVLAWWDMPLYWPVIPLILGLSFFALYVAGDMREEGLLVPAFVAGGIGVVLLPLTLGVVNHPLLDRFLWAWPLLLVILGLVFFFRPRQRTRPAKPERRRPIRRPASAMPRAAPAPPAESAEEPPTAEEELPVEDELPSAEEEIPGDDELPLAEETPVEEPVGEEVANEEPLDAEPEMEEPPTEDAVAEEVQASEPEIDEPLDDEAEE